VSTANAATFPNIFKFFSKNSTSQKTTTAITNKSGTNTEDETIFEKKYTEKDTSILSKEQAGMDIKTKTQTKTSIESKDTKTSEKTKEFSKESDKTKAKWKVTDDGKLKIDGKANTLCFNLQDQSVEAGETQVQKQYEFRSGKVECSGGGFFNVRTEDDPVVEIIECTPVELKAKCREGFVLNYGGSCSYGDNVDLDNRGIEEIYAIPSFFGNDWGTIPASNEVTIRCNTGIEPPRSMGDFSINPVPVDKTLYLTCIREKP